MARAPLLSIEAPTLSSSRRAVTREERVDVTAYLKSSVIKEDGQTVTLSELCEGVTLCVFLRHWGCAECSLLLHKLSPRFRELVTLRARVILIGLGSVEGIAQFRAKHRFESDEVLIVTDPTLTIHSEAGLAHGASKVSGPRALVNRAALKLKGFTNTTIDGDPLQQGGATLLDADQSELWTHRNAHFGDILDPNAMFEAALRASALI